MISQRLYNQKFYVFYHSSAIPVKIKLRQFHFYIIKSFIFAPNYAMIRFNNVIVLGVWLSAP